MNHLLLLVRLRRAGRQPVLQGNFRADRQFRRTTRRADGRHRLVTLAENTMLEQLHLQGVGDLVHPLMVSGSELELCFLPLLAGIATT